VTIAIDPAGKFVLVGAGTSGNGVINVFQINSSTGFLTQTPGAPFASTPNPVQFAFDPAGSLLFVANAGTSTTGTVPGNITEFSIGANGFLTPAPGGQVTTASPSGLALVHFAP
jgi:DNA-binding beta-propeller fold protein YncE